MVAATVRRGGGVEVGKGEDRGVRDRERGRKGRGWRFEEGDGKERKWEGETKERQEAEG